LGEGKLTILVLNAVYSNRTAAAFDWIVSVSNIGSTTATETIVVASKMTTITNSEQMAASVGRLSRWCRSF